MLLFGISMAFMFSGLPGVLADAFRAALGPRSPTINQPLVALVRRGGYVKDDPPLIFHLSAKILPGVTMAFCEPVTRNRTSLPEHFRVLFRPSLQ